jgi:hypothetical protein
MLAVSSTGSRELSEKRMDKLFMLSVRIETAEDIEQLQELLAIETSGQRIVDLTKPVGPYDCGPCRQADSRLTKGIA